MKKKERLTIGCRARILTIKKKPKQKGPNHCIDEDSWRRQYGGREVLLTERTSGGKFAVMILGEGVTEFKREDPKTVEGEVAWIQEEDMVLVDRDFDKNLDFMDWYREHEDEFCPDCGAWFPNRGRCKPDTETWEDCECPKCGYHE